MRTVIAALMLLLAPALFCGAEEPSPFDRKATPDYVQAIKECGIRGIVIAPTFSRVILQCKGDETSLIHGPGERLLVRYNGRDHVFQVCDIKSRSVSFRDEEGGIHEVEWQ